MPYYPILEFNFERGQDPYKSMGIGRIEEIRRYLKENHDINLDVNDSRWKDSALFHCAQLGLLDFVKFLVLREGVDAKGYALGSAAQEGHLDIVKFLMEHGADPNYESARKNQTNETLDFNFIRGQDPLDSMEIGEHYKIKKWLREMGLKDTDYEILPNLRINVFTDVNLIGKNLKELPYYIHFNEIYGGFYAGENEFVSLDGFPKEVYDDLSLFANRNKRWTTTEIKKYVNVLGTIYH